MNMETLFSLEGKVALVIRGRHMELVLQSQKHWQEQGQRLRLTAEARNIWKKHLKHMKQREFMQKDISVM